MPDFEKSWFNKAANLRQEANEITAKALRDAGWRYTSLTPNHTWMWMKEIVGVTYCFALSDAEDIQERLDRQSYFEKFPEELDD